MKTPFQLLLSGLHKSLAVGEIQFDYKSLTMKHQDEFAAVGMVSVWIGNFQTEAQFDDYMNLSKEFEKDFGFRINNRGIREGAVERAPKPIGELVEGFSNWKSFAPAVVEAAKLAGVEQATTMIVFYTVRFDPAKVTLSPNAPLRFLGAFPFS
jgi:hypothetical protein